MASPSCMARQRGSPITAAIRSRATTPTRPRLRPSIASEVAGKDRVNEDLPPMMGAEDFSYMLNARPGAFIFVGNGDKRRPASPGLRLQRRHHPDRIVLLGEAGREGAAGLTLGSGRNPPAPIAFRPSQYAAGCA